MDAKSNPKYGIAAHMAYYHYGNRDEHTIENFLLFWEGQSSPLWVGPIGLYVHSLDDIWRSHLYMHRNLLPNRPIIPHEHGYPYDYDLWSGE